MSAKVMAGLKWDPLILKEKMLSIQRARSIVLDACELKNMVSSIVPISSIKSLPKQYLSI